MPLYNKGKGYVKSHVTGFAAAARLPEKQRRIEKSCCKSFNVMVLYLLRLNAIAYAKEVKQQ